MRVCDSLGFEYDIETPDVCFDAEEDFVKEGDLRAHYHTAGADGSSIIIAYKIIHRHWPKKNIVNWRTYQKGKKS